MLITSETTYEELKAVEKYLTPRAEQQITEAAEKEFGAMYDLPFSTFFECSNDDFSCLGDMTTPTVFQMYWRKRFERFVEEFVEQMKRYTLTQTEQEAQAASGLVKVTWAEGVLVFVQQYFGLKSFREAEQVTMGEILIAKRTKYNQDLFARNLNRIQIQNIKRK